MCGRRGVAPYDHRSQTQTSRAPMRCYARADRHTQAMRPQPALGRDGPVAMRVGAAAPIGAAAAVTAGALVGWQFAPAGWIAAAAVYLVCEPLLAPGTQERSANLERGTVP